MPMPMPIRLFAASLLLALAACASVTPTATGARDWLVQYRVGNGLTSVATDGQLTAFAQAQADAMASRNVLSHDVDGSFPGRVTRAGLADRRIAENVAYGAPNEKQAMEQWKASPAHDANLLMPKASRFGIASARSSGPRPRTYWAMVIAADPSRPVLAMPAQGPAAALDQGPLVRRVVRPAEAQGGLVAPFAALIGQ